MAAGKHLILATVIDVLPGQLTYPACVTCYTKLHRLGSSDQFQCQRCGKLYEAKQVHQRYRLAIKVTNQSVCREVTVFGSCLDPFFGIDATTFSRFIQHAVHHQTGCNELELLHASVTKTLVGHPFYFGFKTSANFSVQSNDYTDSYASLANIVTRDHENLVAVQMTSPFRKWNFPTLVQYLSNIMSNRNGQLVEKGGYVQCSKDECDICPLIAVPQNKNEGVKSENVQETIDDSEKREVNMLESLDLTYLTCSKKDATCDERSRETSLLGETFLSCSYPSFRLSCDKNMSAINGAIYSRLSNGSDHPRYPYRSDSSGTKHYVESVHCETHKESCNLPICTIDNIVSHQETSIHNIHESKSVKECPPNAGNMCIKGDLLVEGCRKSNQKSGSLVAIMNNAEDECAMNKPEDSRRMEDIAVDTSGIDGRSKDTGMTIVSRNKGLEQDAAGSINDSSMIQECEQYMKEWLEENSFDGWSYHEPIQHLGKTHRRSPCLDNMAVNVVPACNEEDREGDEANRTSQPDISHESMCYDFSEDLPFSEDLNQFLHDVEEEHGQSRDRDVARRRHPAQKDNTCISTIGSDKEITVSECERSSLTNGQTGSTEENFSYAKFSNHSDRTESGIHFSMCSTAGTSGLVKGDTETDICYAKERECKESPVCDIQCNTAQEEGKEFKKTQLIRDKLEDLNNRGRKRVDDNVCDDGRVLSKTSLQNEKRSCNGSTVGEVELDSAWSEDCSQSPLLFSQSQSPILPAMPSRHLTSQRYRSQNVDRLCTDDTDNSLPVQHGTTPQLRLDFNLSGQKLSVNKPNDRTSQGSAGENFCEDLQSPDQGTPCLFSQAQDDPVIPSQHSSIPVIRNSRRSFHSRQRTTPLRQLFLQRASSWKMSSTPMTRKKTTIIERSFESPLSCGTPSLFSSENSPDVGGTSSNLGQVNRSKEYSQREVSNTSNSFECTPDLF